MYDSSVQGDVASFLGVTGGGASPLLSMLMAGEIVPGTGPGYQLCKEIYSYHTLGAVLTEAPIRRAQAKPREISIPVLAEGRLAAQYEQTWNKLGVIGGTQLLGNLMSLSRMYGIASLAVGEVGVDPSTPLDMANIHKADLFFNTFDPLNTAGSLVLDQNPNSPSFLKPRGQIVVNGHVWHASRVFTKTNGPALYIDWTPSAFGFVGRSVYQRCLYPLQSYIETLFTNNMVVKKAGLLVYAAESPGSFVDNLMKSAFGQKRAALKAGRGGQVASIGINEKLESLNLLNLEGPFKEARINIIKDIATGSDMPASIILQEAMVSGLADGTEDANKEIDFLDRLRAEMDPAYAFMDAVCRRKSFTPEFYATLRADYSDFGEGGFDTALHDWIRNFSATWPNLKIEPDSEKVKTEEIQMKSVIALAEVLLPDADPETKAKIFDWIAENVNGREHLFAGTLDIDVDKLQAYFEENNEREEAEAREPEEPQAFAERA